MSLYFNGTNISNVYYNGSKIQYVYYNGTLVYSALTPLFAPTFSNYYEGVNEYENNMYFGIDIQNPNSVAVILYWTDNKTSTNVTNYGSMSAGAMYQVYKEHIYSSLNDLVITVVFKASGYADAQAIYVPNSYEGGSH